jgi:DNA-binding NtrC family response regulator
MHAGPPIIGVSKNIQRVRELIKHVASTGLNTVIFGESGVGKEVVAQNLYQQSPRLGKPFIKINCAALPEGLLESELFGYERGAFTGADQKRRGKFQLAHGGVLLLDEIGDMSLPLQAKLLHVLQSGEFAPLGSEKEVKTDTWVIAATNHDLQRDINDGRFREDLYYRLNIIKIYISPLRERPEDIPSLIEYYVNEYASQLGGSQIQRPGANVVEKLGTYSWPGNVRELQNVLKRMLVLGNYEEIIEELFSNPAPGFDGGGAPSTPSQALNLTSLVEVDSSGSIDFKTFSFKKIRKKAVDQVEKEIIQLILRKTDWNRSKASKILKISYKTLLYKISDLGIEPPSGSNSDEGLQ